MNVNDLFQEDDDHPDIDWGDDSGPDERERCHCPFCYCSVRTASGICDMCAQGAHQG